jgi:hypothetical protein
MARSYSLLFRCEERPGSEKGLADQNQSNHSPLLGMVTKGYPSGELIRVGVQSIAFDCVAGIADCKFGTTHLNNGQNRIRYANPLHITDDHVDGLALLRQHVVL